MPSEQAETRDLQAILVRSGLRPTRQRLLVLDVLDREPHDATAQQIHGTLRAAGERIGLATVYRTLASLSDVGAVDTLSHRRGETCYRLCGDAHHHHLLCSECHRVIELEECDLEPWIDDLARAHGFVAKSHELEVTGVCGECRGRGRARETPGSA